MSGATVALIALAIVAAAFGVVYRRTRAKSLPSVSDEDFVSDVLARQAVKAAPDAILAERKRIASVLGIAPEKLTADQTVQLLSYHLSYLADFSVAWSDLTDEAAEARQASGLGPRRDPPSTIGDLVEDKVATAR